MHQLIQSFSRWQELASLPSSLLQSRSWNSWRTTHRVWCKIGLMLPPKTNLSIFTTTWKPYYAPVISCWLQDKWETILWVWRESTSVAIFTSKFSRKCFKLQLTFSLMLHQLARSRAFSTVTLKYSTVDFLIHCMVSSKWLHMFLSSSHPTMPLVTSV